MTPAELAKAERQFRNSQKVLERAREARNNTVRRAAADGWTHAQIAQATGLTRSRVGQITLSN